MRRGAFVSLGVALAIELCGLGLGLSDGGFGWAFEMPAIALCGLAGLTAAMAALIFAILRLMHRRGRDGAAWLALAGALITGLGGVLLVLISLAASASV
ncbi:MAG: hypothetical protein HKN82_11085 [Akkermansiaceae bacterium]|nr:hypothetical protein [Akkermansiaceae bacterium]NNM30618.1 hypothetical protein [Akkermansiaceae bacterium]